MKRRTTMDSHQEEPPVIYKIYVKMLKTVALDVNWTDTVDQIKSKFSAIEGVDKSAQELFFAGIHLKNDKKLADYNIQKKTSVDLYITDGMQISVKIPSVGKTIKLNVKRSNRVADVKAEIEQKEGISMTTLILMYAGQQLEDNQTLSQCNLRNDQTLHALVCPTDGMQISVKIPSVGKTIKLNVKRSNRVADVKAEIEQKEGISMTMLILMYAGQQLEDNQTLSQCNLRNDQTLHALVCPTDNLRVFVNVRGERVVSLDVKCWYTVADVKLMIETLEGLPACTQSLMRPQSGVDMVLADNQTLQAQSVKNNDTLMLEESVQTQSVKNNDTLMLEESVQTEGVQIFIKTWEGKNLTMFFKRTDTTEEVVKRIEEKLLIKLDMYYLCHSGRVLSSGDTLWEHNVGKNSTIDIRLRFRCIPESP